MTSRGVPRVSMFGPPLFIIYIDDIDNSSAKFSFYIIADDTNLLFADINLKSLEKTINSNWTGSNKLTLNAKKWN